MLITREIDENDWNEVVDALNGTLCAIQDHRDCPGALSRECDQAREYLGAYIEFCTLTGMSMCLEVARQVCEDNIPVTSGEIKRLLFQVQKLVKVLKENF